MVPGNLINLSVGTDPVPGLKICHLPDSARETSVLNAGREDLPSF